jgi:hypothetical protein
MRRPSILPGLLILVALAAIAAFAVPRGLAARSWLTEADPVRIAGRALDGKFNAALATREIEQALTGNDADLARSFVDLASERRVDLDPALIKRVNAAVAEAGSAAHATESFTLGFITGEPNDMADLAGMALGDLFVFGDVRDAVREGGRLALGKPADQLVLGLACVGLAITAGTYATLGTGVPARVGLSLAKAARKSGRLGTDLAAGTGHMLHQVVNWGRLKKAIAGASIVQPQLVVRAAREAVKVEHAGGLIRLVRDVGRVETKAGTQAAFDGLKIARSPRELSRIAKLAEKEGSRTRAILKVVGRGAIVLSVATFDLGMWVLGALVAVLAVVSSLKSTTERITLRILHVPQAAPAATLCGAGRARVARRLARHGRRPPPISAM